MSNSSAAQPPPPLYFPRAGLTPTRFLDEGHWTLPERPKELGPVFDALANSKPLHTYDETIFNLSYAHLNSQDDLSLITPRPGDFDDPYLYPMLTRHERLRLTVLWYHTRDLLGDKALLFRLQEKVALLKDFIGWDFAICGLLDESSYQRLATANLPLAILPRRESTCSHTILQEPGSVFAVSDMSQDWRFRDSPHVKHGGLRSYAGTQLRCHLEEGDDVALGSLCVASNTPNLSLTRAQQDTLVRFAAMLTEEIVNCSRLNRREQQRRMNDMISRIPAQQDPDQAESAVMSILHEIYPSTSITIQKISNQRVHLDAENNIDFSDVRHGLWEDADTIDKIITSNNHERLESPKSVRAIVARFWTQPAAKALVVASKDVRLVFDDVDSWFVERCASILSSVAQERSLQRALRAKDQFLRGITHQLRTPIHGVLASVDLLAEEVESLSAKDSTVSRKTTNGRQLDAGEILRTIRNSGRELMSIVNNMIKLNRWAEIVGRPRPASLSDLNRLELDILDDAMQLMAEDDAKHISIFFDNRLPQETSIVMIDMTLLKDCLQSLVLNALQNTANGSVIITISAAEDYSSIIFDVEDTGCGIDPDDQERIFDAYEKGDIHTRGAGLGLTLACRIAEAMNGTVSLVSTEKDLGSHFRAEFQDPGFACPIVKPQPREITHSSLPKTFYVVPSDPASPLARHFSELLKAKGLQSAEKTIDALVVVSFTGNTNQFEELLNEANHIRVAICLVPAGEDSQYHKERHPNVMFFAGPFTSHRVEEILWLTNEACEKLPQNSKAAINTQSDDVSSEMDAPRHHKRALSAMSSAQSTADRKVPRCLLVDDNLINLRIIRMYCEKRKLYYRTAIDGFEAIQEYKEAAESEPLNLILLDLQMPNCDGVQACREIRAFEKERAMTPAAIFIITGQDSHTDREASFAAGADEFYVKPMSLKSLDRGIAQYFKDYS